MSRVILDSYDLFDVPIHNIYCLEDMLVRSYNADLDENKSNQLSISVYPKALFPALKIVQRNSLLKPSISYIERCIFIYSMSILDEYGIIKNIEEMDLYITEKSSDEDQIYSIDTITKLDFCTASKCNETSVSITNWCKEWINSKSHILGISRPQLAIYCLAFGLSKSTNINNNKTIAENIQKESQRFLKYIENKQINLKTIQENIVI